MVSSSSIFISYSRIDSAAAKCVRQMLMALFPQAAVQLDTESVRGGLKWEHEIQALLESCQMVVLLWSRAANSSSWVEGECKMAAELGIPIVVLRLDTQAFASFVAPIQSVEIQDLQSRAPVIGLFGVPILGTLFSLIGLAQESATLASAGCIIATLGLALAAVAERQHHLHQATRHGTAWAEKLGAIPLAALPLDPESVVAVGLEVADAGAVGERNAGVDAKRPLRRGGVRGGVRRRERRAEQHRASGERGDQDLHVACPFHRTPSPGAETRSDALNCP